MKERIGLGLLIVVALGLLLAGCGGGGGVSYTWNYLVYMDGDNNLSSFALENINQMERVGSSTNLNVFVLYDGPASGDSRLYHITQDNDLVNINSPYDDWGECAMDDPATLEQFIDYCQTNYPADRTILTLWDHGGGVYPKVQTKGICWDDTTGGGDFDCLTTDELAGALATAPQRIDLVSMDACLMQMVEVAYELAPDVDYLIGSEQSIPAESYDYYYRLLNRLKNNLSASVASYAEGMADDFYQVYNGNADTTISVLDLANTANAASSFASFATEIYGASADNTQMNLILAAWRNTVFFDYPENRDLRNFADEIYSRLNPTNPSLGTAAANLATAVDNLVLYQRTTGLYAQKPVHGLSVLLPSCNEWHYYSANYGDLALCQYASDWVPFIQAFSTYTAALPADTLTFSLNWDSDDCDLGVLEPNDSTWYFTPDGTSPNGVFSANEQDGGTETWTANASHDTGVYNPLVWSYSYSGDITLTVTQNGDTASGTATLSPGSGVMFEGIYVVRQGARNVLHFNLVPIKSPHVK